jgi:hypothetical protein
MGLASASDCSAANIGRASTCAGGLLAAGFGLGLVAVTRRRRRR